MNDSLTTDLELMYTAERYAQKPCIKPVRVLKLTASFVTYEDEWGQGQKSSRRVSRSGFYSSWSECHEAMIVKAARDVEYAEMDLQRKRSKLGEIRSLKEPSRG